MPFEQVPVLRSRADGRSEFGATQESWVAIVDDHESMRSSLARALRVEGIPSKQFASAEEYLEHAPETAPCCLVLDLQLPRMKGHELAQFLERERPPLPATIFISAHEDLLASLDGGKVSGRLRKPFDLDDLLELVKPLL
jgi:FixJ family two-component response regulator